MKKTIFIMMFTTIAMCCWAVNDNKANKLKVKLDIVDFGDTVVVYHDGNRQWFFGKDGKFEFEVVVDTIYEAILYQPKLDRGDLDDLLYFRVPFVGGEEMRLLMTNRERYDVEGTGFYADYHKVDLFNENAAKESRENATTYREMCSDSTINKETRNKFYNEVYEPSYDRYQLALVDYIKTHPSQEAAVFLLKNISSIDKVKETFTLFDASVREGRMKYIYDKLVKDAEGQKKAEEEKKEAAKKQTAGLVAPAFMLNDINGKPLSLSSLRGKYVVLDFWGSWCIWCIKGFPQMKEYYAKYSGKFEILGVDCNDTDEKWRAAVKKHDLPWLHVFCPKESTLLEDYGVVNFPTKIIIGPDGKIVKSIVGEAPSFYTLLDELFGKTE